MNSFMRMASDEALLGCHNNEGGPFGAVIVRNGVVIATGHNEVIKTNDPTAHAEVVAIRKAAATLKRFDLADCELYASCEPCPMCLSAIYWARIKKVYFGCTRYDAADIGFDDNAIYEYIKNPERYQDTLELIPLDREGCLASFEYWKQKENKVEY